MIRQILVVAFSLGLTAVPAVAADPGANMESLADAAQAAFREGVAHRGNKRLARADFRRAAEYYSQLSDKYTQAPEVYLARGNAWLLAGDLGRAIVSFQEGLRRFPSNEELTQALGYARSKVAYERLEDSAALATRVDRYASWKRWLAGWGGYAIALAAIFGWFVASRWVISRRTSLLVIAGIALAVAGAIAIACFVEHRQRQDQMNKPIVVVAQSAILFSGDGIAYPPRRESPLPAGVEAIVRFRRADWFQVELADGSLGWLPRSAVHELPGN